VPSELHPEAPRVGSAACSGCFSDETAPICRAPPYGVSPAPSLTNEISAACEIPHAGAAQHDSLRRPMTEARFRWLFAGCAFLLALSIVFQQFPPCVDYPQHLATASSLRDVLQGGKGGQLVLLSYNGLFELATALLGLVLPLEFAGRMVLALGFCLQPLAIWRLVRFSGRPPAYAFVWLPCAYSFCLAWGFVNFVMGAALATLTLVAWFEAKPVLHVVLLSLVTAYAHVLGAGFVLLGMSLGVGARLRRPRELLVGVPLALYALLAHLETDFAPRQSHGWSVIFPRWTARLPLSRTLLGSWSGSGDERLALLLLLVVAGICAAALLARDRARWTGHGFCWLFGAAWLLYAGMPVEFHDCWSLFHRFGHVGLLWLPAVLPFFPGRQRLRSLGEGALVLLGLLGTVNFVVHMGNNAEANDANAILAEIPRGSHVLPVTYDWSREPMTDAWVWLHFGAYARVRRGSEVPVLFAREHWTFPVRESWPEDVPLPPTGYEWQKSYDPDADYARFFNVVLARTSDDQAEREPRERLFGKEQGQATLLAHHGRFWLYRFVPDDGRPLRDVEPPSVASGTVHLALSRGLRE
jgi:hypothetical protein